MNRYPDNARVVFIGDSMTHENQVLSHVVHCYKKNFPDSNIKFFNCGTSGASVAFSLYHFEDDIVEYNPTHAVIAFGINDSHRDIFEKPRCAEVYETVKTAFETYKANLKTLCDKLAERNIEITVCTPPPYDEYQICETPALRGVYALMVEYAHFVRRFAAENGYNCCDYNEYFAHLINFEDLFKTDRVHPNEHGYFRMAECFLKMQGLDIGEEAPIPEYFLKWHQAVHKFRNIYAGENCLLKEEEKSLPPEKKYKIMKECAEINSSDGVEKNPAQEYILFLAKEYLKNRPFYDECKKEMLELYEEIF